MSKETFKAFVKQHPELAQYVRNQQMTWQKFYELYDLYGEEDQVWSSYTGTTSNQEVATKSSFAMNELLSMVRNLDLETVQRGVNGLQKAIGLLQEIGPGKQEDTTSNYQERPLYKYYED